MKHIVFSSLLFQLTDAESRASEEQTRAEEAEVQLATLEAQLAEAQGEKLELEVRKCYCFVFFKGLAKSWFKKIILLSSTETVRLCVAYHASPSSEDAYRDRQLTINFELWVDIFCVATCFHVRIVSVCPYPKKRYHHSFVNISPTLVIDTSMERCSRELHHGNQKKNDFLKKNMLSHCLI